jgi:thymidylate kinase
MPPHLQSRSARVIINIRGTSGAGKSHLVRSVMARYLNRKAVTVERRRQPLFYRLSDPSSPRPLMVLGHYETACGGCDTIKTVDEVYRLVRQGIGEAHNVLFEGIMVQDDVTRMVELANSGVDTVRVIFLTTPVEECLRAVQERRDARGDTRPFNPANTEGRARTLRRTHQRLLEGAVTLLDLDREGALQAARTLLGC